MQSESAHCDADLRKGLMVTAMRSQEWMQLVSGRVVLSTKEGRISLEIHIHEERPWIQVYEVPNYLYIYIYIQQNSERWVREDFQGGLSHSHLQFYKKIYITTNMYIGTVVPDIKHIKLCRWPWGPKWPPIQRTSRVSSPTGMPRSKHGNVEVLEKVKVLRIEVLYVHEFICFSHMCTYVCIYFLFIYMRIFIYIFNITPEFHVMHVVL